MIKDITKKYVHSDKYFIVSLIFLIIVIYFPVFNFPFINLDDYTAIVNNPDIKNGFTFKSLQWCFTTTYYDYWHPLTWVTHILDWTLFGNNAGGHHLTNVIFHICNSILLYFFISKLFSNKNIGYMISLLFAIHPIHNESVIWIVERKDVMSMFFGLWSILLYVNYITLKNKKYYYFSIILFILGLMSKPMLITFPLILILIDILHSKSNMSELLNYKKLYSILLNKIPFIILSFSSAILTYNIVKSINAINLSVNLPLYIRILNALNSYYLYFINFFLPLKLSIFHPYNNSININNVLIPIITLTSITLISIFLFKKLPELLIGWIWFIGCLIPVIGLIQSGSQSYADRYAYLPYIGLYILFSSILLKIKLMKKAKILIFLSFLLFLILLKVYQISFWSSTEKLFKRSIELNDQSSLIHNNLGQSYLKINEINRAKYHFKKALEHDYDYKTAKYNLGVIYQYENELDSAAMQFFGAIEIDSTFIDAYISLISCAQSAKKFDLADKYIRKIKPIIYKSIQKKKFLYHDYYSLGKLYRLENYIDSSNYYFKKSLSINPNQWEIFNDMAINEIKLNNNKKAISFLLKSIKLNPYSPEPWHNIALISIIDQKFNETIHITSEAIKKFPNDTRFYFSRARAFEKLNMYKKSRQDILYIQKLDSTIIFNTEYMDSIIFRKTNN